MYKKIIISFSFLIVGICFVFYESEKSEKLSEIKNRYVKFQTQVAEIQKKIPKIYKGSNEIFAKASITDVINQIKNLKNIDLLKIKQNQNRLEIVFQAKKEKDITNSLIEIYQNTSGILQFQSVKILRNARVQLICDWKSYHPLPIDIPKEKLNIKTKLFKKNIKHKLLAIANNNQAFIDNNWYEIGDNIDDENQIISITSNLIKVKNDEDILIVNLGMRW